MVTVFKNIIAFMKPRAIFCVALIISILLSTLLFLGEINTFVINYSGKSKLVRSLCAGVDNAIACAGINANEYKIENTYTDGGKTIVSLLKTYSVFITSGENTVELSACENDTVATALSTAGFTVDEFDMIEPALDTVINDNTYIDYVNIDYVSGSYNQVIPYSVETVYTNKMDLGVKTTVAGENGLEQVSYTQKFVNGQVVETSIVSKVTLLAARNAVQTVGTRKPAVTTSDTVSCISEIAPESPIPLDNKGNPVSYKKHVTVQATAYTYSGHNCATGVAPKPGYIAVNPSIIPYGTKMYIKSSDGKYVYGYAIAADTGGFIYSHATNVDLFFPTKASSNSFGRRNVEIFILE